MRGVRAILLIVLVPAIAGASGDVPSEIIGGSDAMAGAWPDVAAILYPAGSAEEANCTGTLIAPTIIVTAAHCYNPQAPPDNALIGTSSLARPDEGEIIAIERGVVFPDAAATEDVAVLFLARPSRFPPRQIATGWARVDIVNGAAVAMVGFGAINADGDRFVDELQEARSRITDFDCSHSAGCNEAARPAGELGAGGMGVDTCPGDSGGPLYLLTSYGALLAGITSRSYDQPDHACSDGGIYSRVDKIITWLESTTGVPLLRGPEPDADPIVAIRGDGGDTRIRINDPASSDHRFEITTQPTHGTAKVRGDGAVRVCTNPDAPPGEDALTVTITDTRRNARALPVTIKVQIEDGAAVAICDFDGFDIGGCCDSRGRSDGAIPLTLCVLALVIRRRARPRHRRCATLPPWPRPG